MSKYLIDTDVVIEILRGKENEISYMKLLNKKGKAIFYSPITKAEIFHGIREGEEKEVNLLFQSMECIPITEGIGEKAGLYLKDYHRSHNLQLGDGLIAATAYISSSNLLTFNYKHYPMKDIKIVVPE